MHSFIKRLKTSLSYTFITLITLYFIGAICYDGPMTAGSLGNIILSLIWISLLTYLYKSKLPPKQKYPLILLIYAIVIIPWCSITASNNRNWKPEFQETTYIKTNQNNSLTFHNVRNFIHHKKHSTPQWETRTHNLDKLQGIDLFLTAFGGKHIAHPIVSFDFGDEGRLCLSIETRREKDEKFSALGGLFKMFDLQYIFGSEEDLVALRTNIRHETTYLYRLNATPKQCRHFLLLSVKAANALHKKPEFYNLISANCTTSYRTQAPKDKRRDLDWRMLLNGHLDSYLFEKNNLITNGLTFKKLKQQAKINPAATATTTRNQFSSHIRKKRVGFQQ